MSLHIDCAKCGKYLGGISLSDDTPLEAAAKTYDDFFTVMANSVCETKNICPYAKRDTES